MKVITSFFLLFFHFVLYSQEYKEKQNIVYTNNTDSYSTEKCKLDIYYPIGKSDFVTLVWFHGGGLTEGTKEIPEYLKEKNIAIVGVGYRLSPKVKVAEILNDAADAVAWVFNNVEDFGGSRRKIVIGGMSAGAYLSLMMSFNPSYLKHRGLNNKELMGVVSFSAQTITHFTARSENGRKGLEPLVDELAPLYWVNKDVPRTLLLTGDRELELMGRYEENAYLWRMLKLTGHQDVELFELEGYDHNMTYPGYPLLLKTIQKWNK